MRRLVFSQRERWHTVWKSPIVFAVVFTLLLLGCTPRPTPQSDRDLQPDGESSGAVVSEPAQDTSQSNSRLDGRSDAGESQAATADRSNAADRRLTGVTAPDAKRGRPGELAPDITFAMLDDDPIRLTDLHGEKVVVLAFWESWSKSCQSALRSLNWLASSYERPDVAFLAVNKREDKATIRRFVSENQLDLPIALDRNGAVSAAFGSGELPLLVVIGKDGIVQTIHQGFDPRLTSKLIDDLDSLAKANDLNANGKNVLNYKAAADKPASLEQTLLSARRFSSPAIHEEEDFVIELESGNTLDLRKVFTKQGQEFEEKLDRVSSHRNAIRTNYDDGNLFLIVMHLGTRLHGPTAAYYKSGSPMIYLNYEKGKRSGTLFTWDELGRPWVFAEYKSGKKHGLSVVFRACGEACKTGHVWLVQEWQKGKLEKSHLVGESTTTLTLDHTAGTNYEGYNAYEIAVDHFEEFESQIGRDEEELRLAVGRHAAYEARARRAARTARVEAMVRPRVATVRAVPVRVCRTGSG